MRREFVEMAKEIFIGRFRERRESSIGGGGKSRGKPGSLGKAHFASVLRDPEGWAERCRRCVGQNPDPCRDMWLAGRPPSMPSCPRAAAVGLTWLGAARLRLNPAEGIA